MRATYFLLALMAMTACNKNQSVTPPVPPQPPTDTSTIETFDIELIRSCFPADTIALEVKDGRKIISANNDSSWISTEYGYGEELVIYIEENKTLTHRTDTLRIAFDKGELYELTVSQNAYPVLIVSDVHWWPNEPPYTSSTHISATVELGEDVSDMRLLLTESYLLKDYTPEGLEECVQELLSCGDKFGKVYTWNDYLEAIRTDGIFTMEMPDNIGGMVLVGLALDSENNYSYRYLGSWY